VLRIVVAWVVAAVCALWPLAGWAAHRATSGFDGALSVFACAAGFAFAVSALRVARVSRGQAAVGIAFCLATGLGLSTSHGLWTLRAAVALVALCAVFAWWSRATPRTFLIAMLWLCALPRRANLDIVIGWPLRRFAASCAGRITGTAHTETVLAIDSAHSVDVTVACAGIESLLLLLVATSVLALWHGARVRMTLLAHAVSVAILVLCTTLRVVVLVSLAGVGTDEAHTAATLLHEPLGVLAFVAAASVSMWMLQQTVRQTQAGRVLAAWGFGLVSVAGNLALHVDDSVAVADNMAAQTSRLFAAMPGRVVALSIAEQDLFGRYAVSAQKHIDDDTGAAWLAVAATDARAHHAPERCLAANGQVVVDVHTRVFDDIAVHEVVLEHGVAWTAYTDGHDVIADPAARLFRALQTKALWWSVTVVIGEDAVPAQRDAAIATLRQLLRFEGDK
jgi:exosortase/archaeosortase family protein